MKKIINFLKKEGFGFQEIALIIFSTLLFILCFNAKF